MDQDIIIVSIVFGSIVAIVFLGILGSIINSWVKKGSAKNLSENKEFLSALREFKEKTDRRLSNLEAIIADEKSPAKEKSERKKLPEKEQKSAIEIEIENEEKKESDKQSGKLRNMLNQ